MNAVRLWICATCEQTLLTPFQPCECSTLSPDRFLSTPYGDIPAQAVLGTGPLEADRSAA